MPFPCFHQYSPLFTFLLVNKQYFFFFNYFDITLILNYLRGNNRVEIVHLILLLWMFEYMRECNWGSHYFVSTELVSIVLNSNKSRLVILIYLSHYFSKMVGLLMMCMLGRF